MRALAAVPTGLWAGSGTRIIDASGLISTLALAPLLGVNQTPARDPA